MSKLSRFKRNNWERWDSTKKERKELNLIRNIVIKG